MDAEQELDSLLAQFEEELKAGNIDPDDAKALIRNLKEQQQLMVAELPDSEDKRKAQAAIADFWKQHEQTLEKIENQHFNEYLQKRPNRGQF